MQLSYAGIQQTEDWQKAGVRLPKFDWKAMTAATQIAPTWVHFGAGNIFRGFTARLQQDLLEQGLVEQGIVAADTFDFDIIEKIYTPFDSMTLLVNLTPEGTMEKSVVASVAKGLRATPAFAQDWQQLCHIFQAPSLQMVSFTITEKGYALTNLEGQFCPSVLADFEAGPSQCSHAMSLVCALLLFVPIINVAALLLELATAIASLVGGILYLMFLYRASDSLRY